MNDRRLRYGWLVSALTLIVLGWCADAMAQSAPASDTVTGYSSTLTVDARPLSSEIRLDGVRLGTAHELIGRALAVLPGDHVVQVSAEGHIADLVQVVGIPNWATRVQVILVPDRR